MLHGEDLDEFLHDDEFAQDVTLADGAVIRGIFTDASVEGGDRGGPYLEIKAALVKEHALEHGVLLSTYSHQRAEVVQYEINGRQFDGTGMAELILSEAT